MKKEITSHNKLKSYSALAASLIAIGSSADAQVVYTNVTDYYGIFNGDNYPLDLNNDGNIDYNISIMRSTYTSTFGGTYSFRNIYVKKTGSNDVAKVNSSFFSSYADVMSLNSTINNSNIWSSGSNLLMAGGFNYYNFGPWLGAKDQYLGLKLISGGNTYYGWARLDVAQLADTFILKDYAYQLTKNKQILAGDKGLTTSITVNNSENGTVFISDKQLSVKLDGEMMRSHISITDIVGREIQSLITEDKNTLVDMSQYPTGIYMVTIRRNDSVNTTKVYLQ